MRKKISNILTIVSSVSLLLFSCKSSFLEQPPQGVYNEEQLTNKKGINGMLINAYATLDGNEGTWYAGASNWVWGSVRADDAYKGSEPSDQVDINPVERFEVQPSNGIVLNKWTGCYDGIGQANLVLRILPNVLDITDAERKQIEAEAKFLRGHHHFEAKKNFNNVPYIDETVTDYRVPNTDGSGYVNIWPKIEEDLKFAFDNLDEDKPNIGRANKWTAASFLAKAYMFQAKYAEAKALYDQIIANGKTPRGTKYQLVDNYGSNFRVTTEHNSETVFSIQASYGDGSNNNGNYDNALNYPHNSGSKPGGCCGFFQPSQNLVNSYKTDGGGLPMITTYNNADVTNDDGKLSTDAFTPYMGNLDPRVDWSVGRRGVPYYDWGFHPGQDWIRKQAYGGPYSPKKNTYYKADAGATAGLVGWGWANNALNYTIMRYADVLLMAAEAEIEVGSIEKAREYVNIVRTRAGKFAPSNTSGANGFAVAPNDASVTWAKYNVGLYTSAWTDKAAARAAVRFERKLELAMEGHRFFDLVRWGIAAETINNEYLVKEKTKRTELLNGVTFQKDKHEYLPIPDFAITQSYKDGAPTLKQNPGY